MIHWGIIGAGNIAHRFAKSLALHSVGKLYAVGSRTQQKREEFLSLYPDIMTYDDYDALLEDPHIDVVYIATWHSTHYEWSKKALLHHKAVLCEKPAALDVEQMQELMKLAKENNVFFMEAMKTRFIPAVLEMKKTLQEGVIGDVLRVENRFCYDIGQSSDARYLYDEKQGGIFNDVGSYTIASVLDILGSHIQDIEVKTRFDKGVDVHDWITLHYINGQSAYMEVAMDEAKSADMTIIGTKGRMTCTPFYRPTEFQVYLDSGESYVKHKDYIYDDFYTEIEEVHECLEKQCYESQLMSLQDSYDCIVLMEKIRKEIKANF